MGKLIHISTTAECSWCNQQHPVSKEVEAEIDNYCKHPTGSNEPCKRTVDEPMDYCWEHSE